MTNHKSFMTIGAVLVAALFVATSSRAGVGGSNLNNLTLSGSASLPGVVLAPGAYTFEVMGGQIDIVRVTSKAENRVMYIGFTSLVNRPTGTPRNSILTFGESAKGVPTPIVAWFPIGASMGYQFRHR